LAGINVRLGSVTGAFNSLRRVANLFGVALSVRAFTNWIVKANEAKNAVGKFHEGTEEARAAIAAMRAASDRLAISFGRVLAPAISKAAEALLLFRIPTDLEREVRSLEAGLRIANDRVTELKARIDQARSERGFFENLFGESPEKLELELEAAQRNVLNFFNAVQEARDRAQAEAAKQAAANEAAGPLQLFDVAGIRPRAARQAATRREIGGIAGRVTEGLQDPRELAEIEVQAHIDASNRILEERRRRSTAIGDLALEEMQREIQAQQTTLEFRQMVTDSAIGLLHALGTEHRGAAIAALAVTKAIAIKDILIRGQQAAWVARATMGPAGEPIARSYLLMSRISAGLVAATGLTEALQISHGGTQATLGTTANPHVTRSNEASGTIASNRRQSVVEVHIGTLVGWDPYVERRLIEAIRDATDGRDVILFGPGSRQAQILQSP
jgi:hypothetical protein